MAPTDHPLVSASSRSPRPMTGLSPASFAFKVLVAGSVAAILLTLLGGLAEVNNLPQLVWFFSGGLSLAAIILFKRSLGLDWLSTPVTYGILFWVFHFGLVFPASIFPGLLDPIPAWDREWIDTPETQEAVLLSMLFLLFFLFGYFFRQRRFRQVPGRQDTALRGNGSELITGGWICIFIGVIISAVALETFGLRSFLQAYDEFFSISASFSLSIVLIAFGLVLQIAGGRPIRQVWISTAIYYLPVAVPTLLAGSRMATLFSMAVLGIVLAKRGVHIPQLGLVVAVVFLLGLISVIGETRQVGLFQMRHMAYLATANPLAGLAEMGGSLRSVYALVYDLETFGSDYFYGYTYIYPIIRQIQPLLGLPRPDDFNNQAFIAMFISLRYGPVGFSTVAEAFFNGGIPGVMAFALLWGVFTNFLDRRSGTPYGLAALAVVLIPMMINIRSSFIYVPAWIFTGLFIIGFCRYFLKTRVLRLKASRAGDKGP